MQRINLKKFKMLINKFKKINEIIESGDKIPKELTKNFISFPLVDDPYKDIE